MLRVYDSSKKEQIGFREPPWLVQIPMGATPIANTNWNTIQVSPGHYGAARNDSTGVINAEISFDVFLTAGTWTLELWMENGLAGGIADVQLDDVSVGAVDTYSAATQQPFLNAAGRRSIVGIVIGVSGKKRLKLKMSSKHASSSNYYGILSLISFRRTV